MRALFLLVVETMFAPLAALGVILSFVFSSKRGRLGGLSEELPERFGAIRPAALEQLRGRDVWWFHAASAGEVAGLAPLLKALHEKTSLQLVVTTTTRSGRDAARALPWVAWAQLAPLDAWPCVSRFVEALAPKRLILTETELWPTTLILASRAGLKPALINARMTPRSRSRYGLVSFFLAPALRALTVVAAQSAEDGERFVGLGLPRERLVVAGNTKYDQALADAPASEARERARALGWSGAPLFVTGSTHPFEEEMVLAAFLAARRKVPELRLVLAPRHLERAADAADLLSRAGLKVARWSAGSAARADALLLDEMGVLPGFYALARAAFVGGTLVPVGGHNLLEPALAGVPVLFGPHTEHIERPAQLLSAHGGGGRLVRDAAELAARLEEFARDEDAGRAAGAAARATAESLRGATARTVAALEWAGV
ncbi:MAG: 3-deoxy-D-manno-octulosonic acid transferase [Elusimicrobia bacterium]|nr:3-deoxy-D-manno-octulosonic acid transferase [Elusimicrobiota bacterium]